MAASSARSELPSTEPAPVMKPSMRPLSDTYSGFRVQSRKRAQRKFGVKASRHQRALRRQDQEVPRPDDVELVAEVVAIEDDIIEYRRHIHMYPELQYEEEDTANLVATKMREFGIEVTERIGVTGVVGLLQGGQPGPCIALRADMDALPLQEAVDVPFRSTIDGKMHACGHDGHVAMLLGAAQVLARERENLRGTVKFLFQPAEEGGAGALAMINDGLLENPHVDEIYGIHVSGGMATYRMEVSLGEASAASDSWRVEFEGGGGHGAIPENTEDLVLAAANLTTQFNAIIPRNINALESAVLSVCRFDMGTTYNVIPAEGSLWGTLRTFNDEVRSRVVQRMEEMIQGVCASYDVSARLMFDGIGYPPMVNAYREQYDRALAASEAVLGTEQVKPEANKSMSAEDFAYYLLERPGCFFRIGCSDTADGYAQHSPDFFMDERCLAVGASIWVTLIRNILGTTKLSPAANQSSSEAKPISIAESLDRAAAAAKARNCATCATPSCSKMCSRCSKAFYCSYSCQASDWKEHRLVCQSPSS